MSDVRMLYDAVIGQVGYIDIGLKGRDLDGRETLGTAVIMSLFTDRRAEKDDRLPDKNVSRRGWWGDTYPEFDQDFIGSRLWLLHREKQTDETLARAREYVREAVQWLVDDGVASRVDSEVEWVAKEHRGIMGIKIVLHRPDGPREVFKYDYLWDELIAIPALTKAEIDELTPSDALLTEGEEKITTEDDEVLIL